MRNIVNEYYCFAIVTPALTLRQPHAAALWRDERTGPLDCERKIDFWIFECLLSIPGCVKIGLYKLDDKLRVLFH